MASKFLWIDLETNGLSPDQNQVLEFAAVLVDDTDPAMPEVEAVTGVIATTNAHGMADEFVRNMHTANGLWEECASDMARPIAECEDQVIALARKIGDTGIILAGATVHFDKGFIRLHMPRLGRMLSHRVFDVSTMKAAERLYGAPFEDIKTDVHRALPDIRATIAEARALRARRWPVTP